MGGDDVDESIPVNTKTKMKNLILTIGLAIVASVGSSQVDSIVFVDENFNIPIFETAEYNAVGNSWNYELFGPNLQDGTPCLKVNGDGYLVWPSLDVSNVDSLKITINHRGNCCGNSATRKLQLSVDSITWWDYISLPMSVNWTESEINVSWLLEGIDNFYFRIYYHDNTPAYTDNVKVIGYTSEPIIEEPTSCDTVYVEVPIIIYETDIPQECMLDGNGDGMIGIYDLLNLLQYFGQWSPCDVINMNPPPNDWEKNLMEQIPTYDPNNKKTLLKIIDASGREVEQNTPGLIFYIYEDGTVEKRMGVR